MFMLVFRMADYCSFVCFCFDFVCFVFFFKGGTGKAELETLHKILIQHERLCYIIQITLYLSSATEQVRGVFLQQRQREMRFKAVFASVMLSSNQRHVWL